MSPGIDGIVTVLAATSAFWSMYVCYTSPQQWRVADSSFTRMETNPCTESGCFIAAAMHDSTVSANKGATSCADIVAHFPVSRLRKHALCCGLW